MNTLDAAQTAFESRELQNISGDSSAKPMVDMSDPSAVRSTFAKSESQGPVIFSSGEMIFSNPFDQTANQGRQEFGQAHDLGHHRDKNESNWNGVDSRDSRDGKAGNNTDQVGNDSSMSGSDSSTSTAQTNDASSLQQIETNLQSIAAQLEQVALSLDQQLLQLMPQQGDTVPPSTTNATPIDSTPPAATTAVNTTSPVTTTPVDTTAPTTTTQTTNPTTSTTSSDSGFSIQNGQLLANGKLLAGVDVTGQYEMAEGPTAVAQEIASDFPGINVVRLGTSPAGGAYSDDMSIPNPESVSDIVQAVAAFNAKGINVIIDNHSGDSNNLDNVAQDGSEASWFAQIAQAELGNNMVMFQTQNEPEGDASTSTPTAAGDAAIESEQQAAYNAIRATGSNAIVAFDLQGGFQSAPQEAYASTYDQDSNYVIDAHNYAGTVPAGTVVTDTAGELTETANLTEADGSKVPVYIGETGNSMSGQSVDAASTQQLTTDLTDGSGAVFFGFDSPFGYTGGSGDNPDTMLTSNDGALDAYGQQIAALIAQGAS